MSWEGERCSGRFPPAVLAPCLLPGASAGAAASAPPCLPPPASSTPFIPEVGKGVLIKSEKYFCGSSAKSVFPLHCLPDRSRKCRSSPVSLESRSFVAAGPEPEADARHEAWRLSLAAHPARRSAPACSLCLEPPGPATKPCSIIPRDAPGLWLPRKLLANAGAGGPGEQGAVSHLPCHRSQSSPRRMFTELSAGGDAGRSVFQYACLPALGAASEEQRGWLLC